MNIKFQWWFKLATKLILSRMRISYGLWKYLGLFEHGDMNIPSRALDSFFQHAKSADVLIKNGDQFLFKKREGIDFQVLELGPGDSLYTGLISHSLGASHTWMVDVGEFATLKIKQYLSMSDHLAKKSYLMPNLSQITNINDYLSSVQAEYLIEGVESLKKIPDKSIDYCFSNAVLEHIDFNDFELLALELKRILKPSGKSVHRVDLKDHLGGNLNHLRFSRELWESKLFKSSGFYTNRIRFSNYMNIFTKAGFFIECPRIVRWAQLPIDRQNLNREFYENSNDDLLISGFDMVLSLKNQA